MTDSMAMLILIAVLGLYLVPTFVAHARQHPHRFGMFLLNLLLGGTGVFWVVALVRAVLPIGQPAPRSLPPSRRRVEPIFHS
ncbi:superinfection immunity protein [Bradyrhizobium sp. RT3a]|uniref:superinfection immunity protein n=1 Tax=Bradyrhizobium sp. RT3a TaxID=3156333 RepID=UPI00339B1A64